MAFNHTIPKCKDFDRQSAQRVDLFIANSNFVARRIRKFYDRDSIVVYPPVSVDDFDHTRERRDFALVVSELVPYKRIDIAIEAFNTSGQPLVVIGDGPEPQRLAAMARDNITFLGRQPFPVLKEHYETCRVLVFPGIEDFGITPLEAQASGAPVIAFGEGGALETVVDSETGLFFNAQTSDSLLAALDRLETFLTQHDSVTVACRRNAERFSPARFRQEIREVILSVIGERPQDADLDDLREWLEHSEPVSDEQPVAAIAC